MPTVSADGCVFSFFFSQPDHYYQLKEVVVWGKNSLPRFLGCRQPVTYRYVHDVPYLSPLGCVTLRRMPQLLDIDPRSLDPRL